MVTKVLDKLYHNNYTLHIIIKIIQWGKGSGFQSGLFLHLIRILNARELLRNHDGWRNNIQALPNL